MGVDSVETKIVNFLKENKERTNNKSGVYRATLKNHAETDLKTLKTVLRALKDKKQIIVKKGINGHLILLK